MAARSSDSTFDFDTLLAIYEARVQGSTARGRDGVSALHISQDQRDRLIESAVHQIDAGTYRFTPFRQMLKMKGAGKAPRVISIPTIRDRVVLAAIAQHLRDHTGSLITPRPQELVSSIREIVKANIFRDFVRTDIVAFYPSISHEAIAEVLSRHGFSTKVANLALAASRTPTMADGSSRFTGTPPSCGVPSGTPLANVLGELVLSELDTQLRQDRKLAYFRYVDDILVLAAYGQRTAVRSQIIGELAKVGLRAHNKGASHKSSSGVIKEDRFEYLGYTFSSGKVTVDKNRRSRLIDNIAKAVTLLRRAVDDGSPIVDRLQRRAQWWVDFHITGCISENTRRGWLPYYSQVDDIAVLHSLDAVVAKLCNRLPSKARLHPKSFVTAYTYTRNPSRDKHEYVINFDSIVDVGEMKQILEVASDYKNLPSDRQALERLYRRFVRYAVDELERDVGSVS